MFRCSNSITHSQFIFVMELSKSSRDEILCWHQLKFPDEYEKWFWHENLFEWVKTKKVTDWFGCCSMMNKNSMSWIDLVMFMDFWSRIMNVNMKPIVRNDILNLQNRRSLKQHLITMILNICQLICCVVIILTMKRRKIVSLIFNLQSKIAYGSN